MLKGVRRRIERPIREKFKSAIPSYGGDGLLVGMIGRIASRPGLAELAYGQGEVFLIKAGMFMSGVRLDETALEDVGTVWKEDQGQFHYNPSAGLARPPTPCTCPTASTRHFTWTRSRPSSFDATRGRCTCTWEI